MDAIPKGKVEEIMLAKENLVMPQSFFQFWPVWHGHNKQFSIKPSTKCKQSNTQQYWYIFAIPCKHCFLSNRDEGEEVAGGRGDLLHIHMHVRQDCFPAYS